MQCENGNFKVVRAVALNTSFRIDIWNERSGTKSVSPPAAGPRSRRNAATQSQIFTTALPELVGQGVSQ
jgi:hypothetical protein